MIKRNGNKFVSLLLSVFMLLGLMPTATFGMAESNNKLELEFASLSPTSNLVKKDISNATLVYPEETDVNEGGLSLDDESLNYLESYASMLRSPIGAVGFEDEYEPETDVEMVDIIVTLDTMPSAILPIYSAVHNLGISESKAEVITADAVESFLSNLRSIDNKGLCKVRSTLTFLGCTVNMTVPAYMTEAIAALDGVFAVTPDYIITADSNSGVRVPEGGGMEPKTEAYATANVWDAMNIDSYLDFTGLGMNPSRKILKINELNDLGYTGEGIKVGIIDSGVDYNHPDLINAYSRKNIALREDTESSRGPSSSLGYDFIDNDTIPNETTYEMWEASGQSEVIDGNEYYTTHGTHVAGTIGGRGENNSTYATMGVAPGVQLMSYRVLGPYGSGSLANSNAAVERALRDGCKVINLSLGGRTTSAYDSGADFLNNAMLAGTVVVVAAGNAGPDSYTVGTPGISYLSITVGAAKPGASQSKPIYENAVSVSDADPGSPTSFPFLVEGYSFSHGFLDNKIEAPNLTLVAGKGYKYVVVVGDNGAPTTLEQLKEIPDGSFQGMILVIKRGSLSFVDIQPEAERLGVGAFLIINSDTNEGYITNAQISGVKPGCMPFLTSTRQTGAKIIAAYKRAVDAEQPAYLQVGALTPIIYPYEIAEFSSRGPLYSGTFAIKPDISAPGVNILSTQPAFVTTVDHSTESYEDYIGAYGFMDGTSMAAPHIAGIAALMLDAYPNASPLEIKVRMMNSVDQLDHSPSSVYETGSGFVNVYNAITNGGSYAAVSDAYLDAAGNRVNGFDFGSFYFGNTGRSDSEGSMKSKTLPLTIKNTSKDACTYAFSIVYNNNSPRFSASSSVNGVTLALSESMVTIPGGGSSTINVNMLFPAKANSGVYEGRLIVINTASNQEMTLPFAGRLGPSLEGVTVENPWLTRSVISSGSDTGLYASAFATFAHVSFTYSGRTSEQRVFVTDLEDKPVAASYKYNSSNDVQIDGQYVLLNAISNKMYLYNTKDHTYDSTASPLPDGVYKLYLQVTPYDQSYEKQNVFVSKFVVDGSRPVLTVDTETVTEYPNGDKTVTITGNIWSRAAELCVANGVQSQYYQGDPVFGQELNALIAGDFIYRSLCDENGDFTVSLAVSGESRTSIVSRSIYAVDYYAYWIGTYTGSDFYGINKSEPKAIKYTETAGVTSAAASNGLITAGLSNTPINFTVNDFTAEYRSDGDFKPLRLTGYTVTGSGASSVAEITFRPIRRTATAQDITIKLSYKGGASFAAGSKFTVPASVAVYTDNSGAEILLNTEITVDGGTSELDALADLPANGYVKVGGSYKAVNVSWDWAAGITYDGATAGEYDVVGIISSEDSLAGQTIDGAVIIARAQMPVIIAQPTNKNVTQNDPVTLSVTAEVSDGGNLSYQWYARGGAPVSGATSKTYSPNTSTVGTKYYSVVVTNTLNNTTSSATSSEVAVTVNKTPGGETPIGPTPVEPTPNEPGPSGDTSGGGTSGGSTSGGSTSGSTSTTTTTGSGTSVAQVTVKASTATVGGVVTSTASVTTATVASALSSAKTKRVSAADTILVEIKVDVAKNAKAAVLELPGGTFAAVANEKNASLSVDAGSAKVIFDTKALETIAKAAGDSNVSVSVSAVDVSTLSREAQNLVGTRPVFDIKVLSGGKAISNFNGGIATVSVPYTPSAIELKNPAAIMVYYIDETGKLKSVPGKYNAKTGTVDFETGHLSLYAVAFNLKSYPDVPAWAKDAVTFTAARGIVSYSGSFMPDKTVTRGEFLIALMKTYAIDVSNPKDEYAFADISKDRELYAYAAVAREMGITNGSDAARNLFAPDDVIDRQQIAVFFIKALNAMNRLPAVDTGRKLSDYTDGKEVVAWAAPYVETAVKAGLINSTSNTAWVMNPVRMVTRSQMVQLIYNLFEAAE